MQWNPNRPLVRRANAILLWAQGKPKAEIVRLLEAARSSVNRWIKWYIADDLYGLQADLPGKKVRIPPTLQIKDLEKEAKLAPIKQVLASCDAENHVFYEDEVDIHLNPKIGADWRLRGQQRKIVTPGQNKQHFRAGALHSSSGQVTYVG